MASSRDVRLQSTIEVYDALVRTLRAEAMSHWVDLDLTTAQLKVLFSLEYRGPAPIGQIAAQLGVSLPTASHLVERLVQAGYVDRAEDQTDRRRTLAQPSAQGHGLVTRLREGDHQRLSSWLEQLDEDDLEAVHRGIAILARVAIEHSTMTCPFDWGNKQEQKADDMLATETNR